jgi:galactokinase
MARKQSMAAEFRNRFGRAPLVVRSPGRVNLIGEHTDYNEGFVLPAAIDKEIVLAVASRDDRSCRMVAADLGQTFETTLDGLARSNLGWPNYLMGIVDQLQQGGIQVRGFECVFGGDIPIGSGMSSSAALEAGFLFALNELNGLNLDRLKMARMAQRSENEFVGLRCGIMDQFTNLFGHEGSVILLDCRSLRYEYVPFNRADIQIVLCDTQVKHELASSEYNVRRGQCEEGVHVVRKHAASVHSLRDVALGVLEEHRREMDPVVYRRCAYVINENERVLSGCDDLRHDDLEAFGRKMVQSHEGLRDEYQVSCPELDTLVDAALGIDGVYGSRMMGGGFGGCTINLVREDRVQEFSGTVTEIFKGSFGKAPKIYLSRITGGTGTVNPDARG